MPVQTEKFVSLDDLASWLEELMQKYDIVHLNIMAVGIVVLEYHCIAIIKEKTR